MLKKKSRQSKISSRLLAYIHTCVICTHVGVHTCSKCSSVIRLTKSAPDTGLTVTPMIPLRNSLAVGGVATRTVVSRSTRPCGGNLHDSTCHSRSGETLQVFKDNRASAARPVFTQNKHYKNSLVNPTYAGCELSFTPELSSLLLVTSVRFPLFL